MASRRLWVLLLLAGVVSMHGVQVIFADPGGAPAAAATIEHGTGGGLAGSLLPSASVADDAHMAGGTAELTAADAKSMPEGSGHGVASHVLSLCLAVILAGLALLAAASAVRRAPPAFLAYLDLRPRRLAAHFRLPRPPDLSALCLLRI